MRVRTFLKMFSKRGVEVLLDLVKEGLQDQRGALSLRSFHLSTVKAGL